MGSLTDPNDLPIVAPAHMLPVQVARREVIGPDVVTFFLVLPGTEQAPAPYIPGQFVTLALPTMRRTIYRSYSLCGNGRVDQPWEITVKRIQQGTVSTYLYESVEASALLYASLPHGTFTLPADLQPDMPLIFVAVGSGITPIMGMLSALTLLPPEQRPQTQLHYASRNLHDMIYQRELHQLDPRERWLRRWYYLSADGSRLTPEVVLARARQVALQAHWYTCGPETLKCDLHALLEEVGVPDAQVHAEIFAAQPTPATAIGAGAAMGEGSALPLRVEETGAELDVYPNETLLAALERHGYRPDFSCRAGGCGVCRLKVVSGTVEPVGAALTPAERRAGYVLSCVARPLGAVTLASGGRPPARSAQPGAIPGSGVAARRASVRRIRVATLATVGGLLLGVWGLTNHMPPSLLASSNSAAPINTPAVQGDTPTTAPTSVGPQRTVAPGNGAQPTPTSAAQQPTATPKPKPPAPTPTTRSGTSHH